MLSFCTIHMQEQTLEHCWDSSPTGAESRLQQFSKTCAPFTGESNVIHIAACMSHLHSIPRGNVGILVAAVIVTLMHHFTGESVIMILVAAIIVRVTHRVLQSENTIVGLPDRPTDGQSGMGAAGQN